MVGGRVVWIASLLAMSLLAFGTSPASACHGTGDLCLPCDDGGTACRTLGKIHDLEVLGEVQDKIFPDPAEEGVHVVGPMGGDGERRGYIAIAFQWDTANHSAPAGAVDIPIRISFASEDVDFDGEDSASYTHRTTQDDRETFYFTFTAGEEAADIEYTITGFPGTANEVPVTGTFRLPEDDGGMDWSAALGSHWPLWLLFLLVGGLAGFLVARAVHAQQHAPPPPP